jgi:hypothetical protein
LSDSSRLPGGTLKSHSSEASCKYSNLRRAGRRNSGSFLEIVETRVVGHLRLRTRTATQRMAAEREAAALLYGRHDLQLAEAPVPRRRWRHVGGWRGGHPRLRQAGRCTGVYGVAPGSDGPITWRRIPVPTWV